jgi:hypothetical protein
VLRLPKADVSGFVTTQNYGESRLSEEFAYSMAQRISLWGIHVEAILPA